MCAGLVVEQQTKQRRTDTGCREVMYESAGKKKRDERESNLEFTMARAEK